MAISFTMPYAVVSTVGRPAAPAWQRAPWAATKSTLR